MNATPVPIGQMHMYNGEPVTKVYSIVRDLFSNVNKMLSRGVKRHGQSICNIKENNNRAYGQSSSLTSDASKDQRFHELARERHVSTNCRRRTL